MSMKKLKQQVATALIVAMTATNVLSAFAAETVIGKPNKKDSVTVTFDAKGGYWETASKSSASYSDAKHSVEDPVATYSQITRTFDMKGKGFDLSQYNDGSDGEVGNYFVNLKTAGEWFSELDSSGGYSALKHADGDMKFAGWYYNPEEGVAEKVASEKELYDGAKLDAGWTTQIDSNVIDEIIAVGLPDDAKLVVEDLTLEKTAELEAKLPEVLKKHAEALSSEFILSENSVPVGLDIEVTGLTDAVIKENKPITLIVTAPEALKAEELETDEHIKAIHFKEKGEPIVLDVERIEEKDETGKAVYKLVFNIEPKDLFSPFFFVKVKAVEKEPNPPAGQVTVKVIGSDKGFVGAWTQDEKGKKYLPVNEEVVLDKGTELYFTAVPGNYDLEFKSFTITKTADKSEETFQDWEISPTVILENCEISAAFEPWGEDEETDENERASYKLFISPAYLEKPGKYEGTVEVRKWNKTTRRYESFDGWKLEADVQDVRGNAWDLFDFDAEKNSLTSKDTLKMRWYPLSFVLFVKNEDGEFEPEEYFRRSIAVGGAITFVHAFYDFKDDNKVDVEEFDYGYNDECYISDRMFAYDNGADWSVIEELLKKEPLDAEPRMYNYEFVGWQTLDGEKYKTDTRLVSAYESAIDFYAVARFEKNGKPYIGKEEGSNQGGNNNNNNNGTSGSSGGGSRRHVIGGSSSTITSMTGTWTMGENGWKFLKTNGEYATNTWGYINNQWYYFNEAGDMVTGWYFVNGRWYYLNPAEGSFQGAMLTGVIFDPFYNAYFYADANGAMVTGWYQVADKWYYFNPVSDGRQGALLADTVIDGYYVGADGAWVPAS